jgi:hypothetical protein
VIHTAHSRNLATRQQFSNATFCRILHTGLDRHAFAPINRPLAVHFLWNFRTHHHKPDTNLRQKQPELCEQRAASTTNVKGRSLRAKKGDVFCVCSQAVQLLLWAQVVNHHPRDAAIHS